MSSGGTVTRWIEQARTGDAAAIERLWERYSPRLVRLASKKLLGANRRTSDEEDVALSVLDRFFRGAAQGRFAQVGDRDNLWAVLVVMTERRVRDRVRHNRRQKRGGRRVRGDSVFSDPAGSESEVVGTEQVIRSIWAEETTP